MRTILTGGTDVGRSGLRGPTGQRTGYIGHNGPARLRTAAPRGPYMLASLIMAVTLGAPEVRMPPDYYHACITEHPHDSVAFWRCALDLDAANRQNIGHAGFDQLDACRAALADLDPTQDHRFTLDVDSVQIECEGRPRSDARSPGA